MLKIIVKMMLNMKSGRDGIENSIYWCFDEASE